MNFQLFLSTIPYTVCMRMCVLAEVMTLNIFWRVSLIIFHYDNLM